MKKLKVGDVLKIPKSHRMALKDFQVKYMAYENQIKSLAEDSDNKKRELWMCIGEIFPEVKKFNASYDYTTDEIIITRKLEEWEKDSRARQEKAWKLIKDAKEKGFIKNT